MEEHWYYLAKSPRKPLSSIHDVLTLRNKKKSIFWMFFHKIPEYCKITAKYEVWKVLRAINNIESNEIIAAALSCNALELLLALASKGSFYFKCVHASAAKWGFPKLYFVWYFALILFPEHCSRSRIWIFFFLFYVIIKPKMIEKNEKQKLTFLCSGFA